MKSQLNQSVKSIDTVSVIMSLIILTIVIVPILGRRIDGRNMDLARQQAEEISRNITFIENLTPHQPVGSSGRHPASAGEGQQHNENIKLDPWGQPFRYQYLKNSKGQPIFVAVWSSGPNATAETNERDMSVDSNGAVHAQFGGDDVGFIRVLR